jgi:hypothetical protein
MVRCPSTASPPLGDRGALHRRWTRGDHAPVPVNLHAPSLTRVCTPRVLAAVDAAGSLPSPAAKTFSHAQAAAARAPPVDSEAYGEMRRRMCWGDGLMRKDRGDLTYSSICRPCCPHPLAGTTILAQLLRPQPGCGELLQYLCFYFIKISRSIKVICCRTSSFTKYDELCPTQIDEIY